MQVLTVRVFVDILKASKARCKVSVRELWGHVDELATVLASLYPGDASIRRFAGIAGVGYERISGETPLEKWGGLLVEAEAQGVVGAVVGTAVKEYPVYMPLLRAVHGLGIVVGAGAGVDEEIARLKVVVEKHETKLQQIWHRLNPSVRQTAGIWVGRVMVGLWVLSWVVPEVASWYVSNWGVAIAIAVCVCLLAILARWLPG